MKARKVSGLDPDDSLADAARRIAAVRASEVESFAVRALDPAETEAQHDMRIAAKRLRHVLELAAPALDEEATRAARRAKRLQAVLGDVRECDELHERARGREGLEPLVVYLTGRRATLFESFVREWRSFVRGE